MPGAMDGARPFISTHLTLTHDGKLAASISAGKGSSQNKRVNIRLQVRSDGRSRAALITKEAEEKLRLPACS